MSDAILALRAAVQARLAADAALTALIGPDRIFDEAPRAARGLYVVHGEVEARDWSTGSDRGCEQEFALVVWAAQSGSSRQALEASGRRWMQVSLDDPRTVEEIAALAPVGVIQATSLGMKPGDPRPFAELLDAAAPSLKWAVEWIYKEDTAFAQWARGLGLPVTDGGALFELQAIAQSQRFIAECGG